MLDSYLRDFPVKSFEIPDRYLLKNRQKYSDMGFLRPKSPAKLTQKFIIHNSEYSLQSQTHHWRVWTWRQIVLIEVSGIWAPEQYPYHFSDFWDIFCERKRYWNPVYFIVDANDMPIQSEGFRSYVKKNWSHLIQRDDFQLCIVENKGMKRAIWNSIYQLLGVQDRVKMFKDQDRAVEWVDSEIKSTMQRECRKS